MDSTQNNREYFFGFMGMIRRDKYLVFFDGTIYYRKYYTTRENGPDSIGSSGNRTWPENDTTRSLRVGPTSNLL